MNNTDNPRLFNPQLAVNAVLDQVEREHRVRVLFAVESGSRAWGFPSPDSDYDVRFVYVHERDWYLSVEGRRDVIEVTQGDLDVSGWELRKALRLLRKSNPSLLEWIGSPLSYRADPVFTSDIRALAERCLSPERCFQHYFHLARNQWQKYLQADLVRLKRYLYVLRPVLACRWLEQERGAPPVAFADLVSATLSEAPVRRAVEALLEKKAVSREMVAQPPDPVLHRFLEKELLRLQPLSTGRDVPSDCYLDELDHFFQTVALAA
jgi:predicted nucleotidyltransferase